MASNIDDNDLVKCPICFEQFTNPKYLPCLHTFCHLCLKSYIVSQLGGEGQKSKSFPCPVCRQTVQAPEPNLSSEKIADAMPGNHLITSLLERSQTLNKDDYRKTCDPCQHLNQSLPADTWCTICLEALCENCASCHKRLKQSRNHPTVLIGDAFKDHPVSMIDVDEPCPDHSGKVLEVYCLNHKQMCCVICLATQHRRCDNISTFEDMVKGSKDEESVEDFTKRLLEVDEKTAILRSTTEEYISSLDLKHGEIAEKVSSVVQTAIDKLQNQKTRFLLKLKQMHKERNVLLTERKERIETFHSCVKNGYKMMQAVCEQGSPKQVFVTKQKLKMQLKNHMKHMKHEIKDIKSIEYVLHVDDAVSAVIHSMTSVAKVELTSSSNLSEGVNSVVSSLDPYIDDIDIMDLEVAKVCSLEFVKAEITGGTFLPNGEIVFCDYTNDELKMYAKSGKHLSDTQLNGSPFDATCIPKNEILVSFKGQSNLKRYDIKKNTFEEICVISCKPSPQGLAFINDNVIVGYASCLDIITLKGICLNSIPRISSDSNYCYVAALKANIFYHNEENHIICRSIEGNELFRYVDPTLQYPAGIALDCYGNVLVCCYDSGNLHIVSRDGQKGRILMTDLTGPFGIGFNTDGTRFFLTSLTRPSLDVFDLSVKRTKK